MKTLYTASPATAETIKAVGFDKGEKIPA